MEPGALRDVLTVLAGVGTGMLSAAFGVGGAVVSTPAIRALGVGALTAIGTTLPSILPSAASGALRYSREHLVDWQVVARTVPAGVVAAVVGSLSSHAIPGDGHILMIVTALLLGVSAIRMARRPEATVPAEIAPDGRPPSRHDRPLLLAGIGACAGGLSGLLGVGGGVVMVPAFSELARLPLKTSIATSLACVGLFAVPGTVTHALLGGIDWRVALVLAVGVVPGARIGAALALRATDRRLRVAVSLFLGTVAVVYLVGEVRALAS